MMENYLEIEPKKLLLLTCLNYIIISMASFLLSLIYDSFKDLCFGFEETKLTQGKLYGELRPVLKYNFKEQD